MIMRISFGILLLVMGLCFSNSTFAQSCKFDRSKPQDGLGGHILTTANAGSVGKLVGRVLDPRGEPIPFSRVVVKRLVEGTAIYVGTQAPTLTEGFVSVVYRREHTGLKMDSLGLIQDGLLSSYFQVADR